MLEGETFVGVSPYFALILTQRLKCDEFHPDNKGLKLENRTEFAYLTLQCTEGEEYRY